MLVPLNVWRRSGWCLAAAVATALLGPAGFAAAPAVPPPPEYQNTTRLNSRDYFEAPGLSVLLFHNDYAVGKQGGLEIILHGERIATNGDLMLRNEFFQIPDFSTGAKRVVDAKTGRVTISAAYPAAQVTYKIQVQPLGSSFRVTVDLDQPLPAALKGRLGFALQLFPPAYFGKGWLMDQEPGVFPRQFNGPLASGATGSFTAKPLAEGRRLDVAPDDPAAHLTVEAVTGKLALMDGRYPDQIGWYTLWSELPTDRQAGAVEWIITPHVIPGWKRAPVLAHSQVGYHPAQAKRAIIELEPRETTVETAVLVKLEPDGTRREVLAARPEPWGLFLRYQYLVFDFTAVREPGLYQIRYGQQTTAPFKIHPNVYQSDVWQPTLETFFPVQMCHLRVRDRAQVWHGACHLDDALQAPPNHDHFDDYRQGPTDTHYQAYEHIPGLDIGGWHDAGDYDLAAGSQATTLYSLILAREAFGVATDQTTILQQERLVLLHQPDGKPDILQQIEHGLLTLLAGYRAFGHCQLGIIAPTRQEYCHMGDAATMTDGRVYQAALARTPPPATIFAYDRDLEAASPAGAFSGRRDDRWVFTSRDSTMEYRAATVFAAASRVLRGYNNALADECLATARTIWSHEQSHQPASFPGAYTPGSLKDREIEATIELLVTTRDPLYRAHFVKLRPAVEANLANHLPLLWRARQVIRDEALQVKAREAAAARSKSLKSQVSQNPFQVAFNTPIWGIAWDLQAKAVDYYYLCKAYPDLFDREQVLSVLNYVLGCHPGSDVSFVSGVGARSMTAAYGANRGQWFYIPGGESSGTAMIQPDYPELKTGFPFLWQQAEYVMPGAASYIFAVLAANDLLTGESQAVPQGSQQQKLTRESSK
ncbi:MAG: glycoside hydrolase family 9 protein [Lentisphaeria bacterium]